MTVAKKGSKYVTKHCHGKNKDKVIAEFDTKEEALAQHKAIQVNKKKKKGK